MIKKFSILFVFALVFIYIPSVNASTYRKSSNFKPIKITYEDLSLLLQRIHAIIPDTPKDQSLIINKLLITDGKLQIDIDLTSNFEFKKQERFPKTAFDLSYIFYNPDSKIQKIEFRFTDYQREVSVEGTDSDMVDSAFDSLVTIIEKHTYMFGGSLFRSGTGFNLIAVGLVLINLRTIFSYMKKTLSDIWVIIWMILGCLLILFTSILPFEKWFPGFAIYAEPLSFIQKYTAEITFIGTVLAAITSMISMIRWSKMKLKQKKPSCVLRPDVNN